MVVFVIEIKTVIVVVVVIVVVEIFIIPGFAYVIAIVTTFCSVVFLVPR